MASGDRVKLRIFQELQKRYSKMQVVKYKHSMPTGDLLSLLPGLRQVWRVTGNKALIYQRLNLTYSGPYPGAIHSIMNEKGEAVTMNEKMFQNIVPLLQYQDYIEDILPWKGEETQIDFDALRIQETTMPYGSIGRWPFYIFPDMACDLSEPCIDLPDQIDERTKGKIIINRTDRYTNMFISYSFLKSYRDDVIFAGLPEERDTFCYRNDLDIPCLQVNDFLELAIAFKSCKLFIGNQSMAFQICEHLKTNRVLEVCKQVPNVIGSGKGFYDFLNQYSLQYYVDKLFNE